MVRLCCPGAGDGVRVEHPGSGAGRHRGRNRSEWGGKSCAKHRKQLAVRRHIRHVFAQFIPRFTSAKGSPAFGYGLGCSRAYHWRWPRDRRACRSRPPSAVQQRCARLRVHVVSQPCGPGQWPGRDVDGQENGAEGPTAFGSGEKRNHPWADWQARSSLEPSAHQAITPGPCRGWGRHRLAHIRAQREPVLHRRAPAPITADHEGSPGGSCSLASHRETLRRGRKKRRSTERAWCGSQKATFRSRGRGRLGGTRTRIKKALRAGRPAGHAAECGQGPRRRRRARLTGNGAVRSLCGYGAGARRRA